MKKVSLFILLALLINSCSSNDEENFQSLEGLSELLTRNAWIFDREEIIEVTSHGNLTYQEAEQVILNNLNGNPSNVTTIYSFETNNEITVRFINENGSTIGTQNFNWIILPDGKLRFFNMGTLNNMSEVYSITVNNELLTLSNDREILHQGTLIKYIAKSFFNKQ